MATVPLRLEPARSNASKTRRYPPGPTLVSRILNGRIFRQSAIDYMQACAAEYGDLVHYMAATRHIYQLNHPDLIADYFSERRCEASSRRRDAAREKCTG